MTDLESRNCIVCGCRNVQTLYAIGEFPLVRCSGCGLEFLFPQPDRTVLEKLYQDYYSSWGIDHQAAEVSAMKKNTFRGFLNHVPRPASHATFLDIGCATGEMLTLAREQGFDVYGVEISPKGKQLCRELFGEQKIIGKNLDHGDFPDAFFDVITLSDVLEHIPDPPAFLEILQKIMKPNGMFMIVTPDTSSWTRRVMGRYWPHYKVEHLHYFNRANLARMCSGHFDLLISRHAYKSLTLNYVSGIVRGYHQNFATGVLTGLIELLPERWKSRYFTVHIGEMFMLLQKRP